MGKVWAGSCAMGYVGRAWDHQLLVPSMKATALHKSRLYNEDERHSYRAGICIASYASSEHQSHLTGLNGNVAIYIKFSPPFQESPHRLNTEFD